MIATAVMVHVKKECLDAFIRASIENHENSVKEPGNIRFDICRLKDDPERFMLYEAYRTPEAAAAHKDTPHYAKWKETVADMMAEPRQGIKYDILCPAEKDL